MSVYRLLPLVLLLSLAHGALANGVTVLVEPYPPFVTERSGKISGPYVDSFEMIAQNRGIKTRIVSMPIRRALQFSQQTPDTCVLALNYSASDAEVLIYLSKITPIFIWAYARRDAQVEATSLNDLKNYKVSTVDMAEVRYLLDDAGIKYVPLHINALGLKMLNAKRFDVLLSDVSSELAAREEIAVTRLFTVAQLDRWLACNPKTDSATQAVLREALKEGLFSEETRAIWVSYGMGDYYKKVRNEWSPISKSH
ncbi:hypothetical protein SAMN05421553_4006 [Pseudomonas anguilliseptica]|uniref:Amino acid ABC transporter substrate-binding protein, PAAT family n=2 Tax=Pseudomonas anguilliseptica TaxID=53406 RepID=A0A1H5FZM5_PSEAG|nr:hypothetical protein SAMN05421553_4006 [Pseudomonas anguilliseptica]